MVSTPLKNISQIGNLPVGVKIKNIWNHHLEKWRQLKTSMTFFFPANPPRLPSEFGARQKETQKIPKNPSSSLKLQPPSQNPEPLQPLDIGSKIPRPSSLKPTFKAFAKSPPWAPIPGDRNHTSLVVEVTSWQVTVVFNSQHIKRWGASKNIKQPNFWAQNCS